MRLEGWRRPRISCMLRDGGTQACRLLSMRSRENRAHPGASAQRRCDASRRMPSALTRICVGSPGSRPGSTYRLLRAAALRGRRPSCRCGERRPPWRPKCRASAGGRCRSIKALVPEPGEQTGDAEIDVEPLPMQTKAQAENLNVRQVLMARPLEALRQANRESEAAAVAQLDMNACGSRIIANSTARVARSGSIGAVMSAARAASQRSLL